MTVLRPQPDGDYGNTPITAGNIDLNKRPIVKNPDGSISTVRSITVTDDTGRAILIPTVVGKSVVSNDAAIKHFQKTGEHLGVFRDGAAADRYAEALHRAQARQYAPKPKPVPDPRMAALLAYGGPR